MKERVTLQYFTVSPHLHSFSGVGTDLVRLASGTARVDNGTVDFNITDIKKLIILQTVGSTSLMVRSYIVKFTKLASKLQMCFVKQVCLANDRKTIL